MVDRSYRGHDYQGIAAVHIAGRFPRKAIRSFGKMLERRCVVEPTIVQLRSHSTPGWGLRTVECLRFKLNPQRVLTQKRSDHRLERNLMKCKQVDNINARLSGVGDNKRKLLRHLKTSACAWISGWIHARISTILTKYMRHPSNQVA